MLGTIRFNTLAVSSVFFMLTASPALAQELMYQPVNPSFGGDSFNSAHLIGIANAQNDYKDPKSASKENSQMDQFVRQLQSRLLSSLAAQVNDAIFGANPQESGTITFGDQVITFQRGIDSVQLTIEDLVAGTRTEISIPLLGGASASVNNASELLLPYMNSGEPTEAGTGSGTLGSDDPLSSDPFLAGSLTGAGLGDVTLGGQ